MHALGLEFGSAAQLSKRPGSVWNCLWGNALKRSPGIIRKSRISYPGPGFLSSATWPSLPKKHYNGLNQTKLNQTGHNPSSQNFCEKPMVAIKQRQGFQTVSCLIGYLSKIDAMTERNHTPFFR